MKMTIVAADKAIKERSKKDRKNHWNGTTVVMAWLLKDRVTSLGAGIAGLMRGIRRWV